VQRLAEDLHAPLLGELLAGQALQHLVLADAEVETHAWLEALVPPGEDGAEPMWVGIDPTNRCLAGENYVKIGHGRHYRDVPPIKGVYRGTATAELDASVRMHRTDAAGARV
jgi:transglutaminase-like putative cysteine protease